VYSGESACRAFFPANLSGYPWNKHASAIAARCELVKADHIRRVMGYFYKTNLFLTLKKKKKDGGSYFFAYVLPPVKSTATKFSFPNTHAS
jgi:hypothetical protein